MAGPVDQRGGAGGPGRQGSASARAAPRRRIGEFHSHSAGVGGGVAGRRPADRPLRERGAGEDDPRPQAALGSGARRRPAQPRNHSATPGVPAQDRCFGRFAGRRHRAVEAGRIVEGDPRTFPRHPRKCRWTGRAGAGARAVQLRDRQRLRRGPARAPFTGTGPGRKTPPRPANRRSRRSLGRTSETSGRRAEGGGIAARWRVEARSLAAPAYLDGDGLISAGSPSKSRSRRARGSGRSGRQGNPRQTFRRIAGSRACPVHRRPGRA